MFKNRLLILIISSLFSLDLLAVEKVLCTVTNDVDKELGKMVYEMDPNTNKISRLFKERYTNGKLVERVELSVEDLLGDGLVLNRKDKYVTVRMYSDNFDQDRGGILYLDTLHNGVNGERKEYILELYYDESGPVIMSGDKKFTNMHFIAKRSRLLGVIGIEKVQFN